MKCIKSITTLLLALTLVFAMALPSFALQTTGYVPTLNGMPYYIQGADSLYEMDGEFTVYLSLYSGIYDGVGPVDVVVPVTMGSSGATGVKYTVAQVLTNAQSQYSGVTFDMSTPDPTHYHSSYLFGVEISASNVTVEYNALPLMSGTQPCYSGWMFRINGMIPFYIPSGSSDPLGCLITDAYVTPYDVIDLYYDNMFTRDLATKVFSVLYSGTNLSGDTVFQVVGTESYCDSVGDNWTVTPWAKATNYTFDVTIDGTTYYSITTSNQGKFSISGLTLSSGTHTVQIKSVSRSTAFTYEDEDNVLHYYKVPEKVGMYCRLIVT